MLDIALRSNVPRFQLLHELLLPSIHLHIRNIALEMPEIDLVLKQLIDLSWLPARNLRERNPRADNPDDSISREAMEASGQSFP